MTELKPCPFCGATDPEITADFYDCFFVVCGCGSRGPDSKEPGDNLSAMNNAATAWNERVEHSQGVERG
ncbi:restriction alleviation protein, Lar family [Serratia rubidaea]|nr:restriction alleviation protein, Lar family [Serratia rubidaea]